MFSIPIHRLLFFPSHLSRRDNIFGSICASVCLFALCRLDLKFVTDIRDHHISDEIEVQGHRSKVKVTKVNNVKILVFSLISEKVVQGQGHRGQGQRSRSKVARAKLKGHKSTQGCRVQVKFV